MKTVSFVVEAGNRDVYNDIIVVDGIDCGTTARLMDTMIRPLGICKLKKENGKLVATATIDDDYLDYYPSIAYRQIEHHQNEFGGTTVVKSTLIAVSLAEDKNADESIKKISEQRYYHSHL